MTWNKIHIALTTWRHSQQGKNLLSMVGAEMVAKCSRIITLIMMAVFLVPEEYGIAMLALAWHDMVRLILRCGAGAQIVQCDDEELPAMARNAMLMQWLLCLGLALLQYAMAEKVGNFYQQPKLAELLQWLCGVYLLYPFVSVKVFLIQRSNQLSWFGFCNGFCVVVENVSIAAILCFGANIEAIVYGKYIYALLWIALFLPISVKGYGLGFECTVFCRLVRNSTRLFQSELSRALRINLDLFVAGKLLVPEVFGIYSFAKSASVAISQALSNAVTSALYPQLCLMQRKGVTAAQLNKLLIITLVVTVAYLLQGITAHLYIPWFFGERWQSAITATVFLCLSAVPAFLLDMLCVIQRAKGAFRVESRVRIGHLLVLLAAILWLQPASPQIMSLVVLGSGLYWLFCCSWVFHVAALGIVNRHLNLTKMTDSAPHGTAANRSDATLKPQERTV